MLLKQTIFRKILFEQYQAGVGMLSCHLISAKLWVWAKQYQSHVVRGVVTYLYREHVFVQRWGVAQGRYLFTDMLTVALAEREQ